MHPFPSIRGAVQVGVVAPDCNPTLIDAARAFNSGHYFEAHELLEDALDTAADQEWDLFVALVQTAVGYHKITQGLLRGAARMLERALHNLERYPATAASVNLTTLRARMAADIRALDAGSFDPAAFARDRPRLQPCRRAH